MELVGSDEAGRNAGLLLQAFRRNNKPIIHVQHIAAHDDATFFLPDTAGVNIHESVAPLPGEKTIQKHFPSSFRETPLLAYLKSQDISSLVIAGMMTHMCIDTTTRAAADLGFDCVLAHDGCATRALSFGSNIVPAENVQNAFLASIDGTFAAVRSTKDICSELP